MKALICCLVSLLFVPLQKQSCIDWTKAENCDFYKVERGKPIGKVTWTEIDKQPHVRLNQALEILKRSTCKPIKSVIWKDQFLLVVSFKNGERKRFIISSMTDFLVELGGKRYEISETDQEKWSLIIYKFRLQMYNQTHKDPTV